MEQIRINNQAKGFLAGIIFSSVIFVLLITIFVISFALFSLKADVFGYLYVNDPVIQEALDKIRMIASDLLKWSK